MKTASLWLKNSTIHLMEGIQTASVYDWTFDVLGPF